MYSAEDYKRPNGQIYHTYPSLKFAKDQEALWAGDQSRRHPDRRHRRDLLSAPDQTAGPPHRRHDRRQCRGRAAPVADLHRDRRKARLRPLGFCRPRLGQRRQDHGPLPEEGRARGRLRRRHRAARPAPPQHRARRRDARGRLHARGKAATSPPGRRLVMLRGKIVVDGGAFMGDLKDGQFLPRKVPEEIRNRPSV